MGAMATEFATTKEACDEAQVPQVWRDACAHLLIPLNACRKKEFYLPWKYVNTNTTLMLSAAHLLEVWGGRNAPQTPHTRPTQAIASALTPKFYSISTLPFSFLFLDTNRTTSFSFVLKQPPPRLFERCEHERHVYELCQYKDYKKRVKAAEDAK